MVTKNRFAPRLLAILILASACRTGSAPNQEMNFTFSIEKNLIFLAGATVDSRPSRVILGTASPLSIRDSGPVENSTASHKNPIEVRLGHRYRVVIDAETADLGGVADLLLGNEAFPNRTVVVDFGRQLISVLGKSESRVRQDDLNVSRFQIVPEFPIEVDGARISAMIDTGNPDTLTLPLSMNGGRRERRAVDATIAGTRFRELDVSFAGVSSARIGNRILQHFLIRIDFQKKQVALWKRPERQK